MTSIVCLAYFDIVKHFKYMFFMILNIGVELVSVTFVSTTKQLRFVMLLNFGR